MRIPRVLVLLLVASLASGCLGSGQEAGGEPAPGGSPTPESGRPAGSSFGSFVLEGPRVVPGDGRHRPLYEDDVANVTFTLSVPPGESSSTGFVTLALDGEVVDVQNVHLQAGENRTFHHVLGPVADMDNLTVEVRTGAERARVQIQVHPWPRPGEAFALGPLQVVVRGWFFNRTSGAAQVNLTIQRGEGDLWSLAARVLCVTEEGFVSAHGRAGIDVPPPGDTLEGEALIPRCPEGYYGVELTGEGPQDDPSLYHRVLFVAPGWRPAPDT